MIVSSHIVITVIIIAVIISCLVIYKGSKTLFYCVDNVLDKIFSKFSRRDSTQHFVTRDPLYDQLYNQDQEVVDDQDQEEVDYIVNTYYDNPAYDPNSTVPEYRRDPQRTFNKKDIEDALYRAQYQCEHVDNNGNRCVSHLELQADHHYPHSRGGATRYDPTRELNIFENNLVILCGKHNRMKTNRHPSRKETMRIEEMRYQTHYYS